MKKKSNKNKRQIIVKQNKTNEKWRDWNAMPWFFGRIYFECWCASEKWRTKEIDKFVCYFWCHHVVRTNSFWDAFQYENRCGVAFLHSTHTSKHTHPNTHTQTHTHACAQARSSHTHHTHGSQWNVQSLTINRYLLNKI